MMEGTCCMIMEALGISYDCVLLGAPFWGTEQNGYEWSKRLLCGWLQTGYPVDTPINKIFSCYTIAYYEFFVIAFSRAVKTLQAASYSALPTPTPAGILSTFPLHVHLHPLSLLPRCTKTQSSTRYPLSYYRRTLNGITRFSTQPTPHDYPSTRSRLCT